jgi:hypothetical protein
MLRRTKDGEKPELLDQPGVKIGCGNSVLPFPDVASRLRDDRCLWGAKVAIFNWFAGQFV